MLMSCVLGWCELASDEHLDAERAHLVEGALAVARLQVAAAAAVGDHVRAEAELPPAARRPERAVGGGESREVDLGHAASAEVILESRRLPPAVVEEGAVAVDAGIRSLPHDLGDARAVEIAVQLRAVRALHAVVGPEDLREAVE